MDINRMQQQLMSNPEMMASIMNSPMMEVRGAIGEISACLLVRQARMGFKESDRVESFGVFFSKNSYVAWNVVIGEKI